MRFRLFCSLWILLLVPAVFAADAQLIYSGVFPNIRIAKHVEPILDANGEIEGFVVSDTSQTLRLIWLDGRSEDSIALSAWPHKTINYSHADTLDIYAVLETSSDVDYFGTWPNLVRISLVNGVPFTTKVIPQLYWGVNPMEYMSSSPQYENIKFLYDEMDGPTGVAFESRIFYHGYILTIGTHDGVAGTGIIYSPDLATVMFRKPYAKLHAGHFTSNGPTEFLGTNEPYYYFYDFDNMEYPTEFSGSSMTILDTSGISRYSTNRDWIDTYEVITGNFFAETSLDEVFLFGSRPMIDTTLPSTPYFACYGFEGGSPTLKWHQSLSNPQTISGLVMMHYSEAHNAIVGTRKSRVLFLSTHTGLFGDSVDIGRTLSHARFFTSEPDSPLTLSGHVDDSIFVYQFDEITDAPEDRADLPFSFTLSQNYPNPFNSSTEIRFSFARAAAVTLTVYNLLGQEVKTLLDEKTTTGEHRVTWDGRDNSGDLCATGIYLYRLQYEDMALARKMVMLK